MDVLDDVKSELFDYSVMRTAIVIGMKINLKFFKFYLSAQFFSVSSFSKDKV